MEVWCSCRKPQSNRFMIGCDGAKCDIQWYHGSCVAVTKAKALKMDNWICLNCTLRNDCKKLEQRVRTVFEEKNYLMSQISALNVQLLQREEERKKLFLEVINLKNELLKIMGSEIHNTREELQSRVHSQPIILKENVTHLPSVSHGSEYADVDVKVTADSNDISEQDSDTSVIAMVMGSEDKQQVPVKKSFGDLLQPGDNHIPIPSHQNRAAEFKKKKVSRLSLSYRKL